MGRGDTAFGKAGFRTTGGETESFKARRKGLDPQYRTLEKCRRSRAEAVAQAGRAAEALFADLVNAVFPQSGSAGVQHGSPVAADELQGIIVIPHGLHGVKKEDAVIKLRREELFISQRDAQAAWCACQSRHGVNQTAAFGNCKLFLQRDTQSFQHFRGSCGLFAGVDKNIFFMFQHPPF